MSFSQPSFPAGKDRFPLLLSGSYKISGGAPPSDVRILTSVGLGIPAHSSVLASASTVLKNILDRHDKRRSYEKIIPIHGVPCDAVAAFIRFFYTSKCEDEEMDKYGIHLLALSHVFSVPKLKQRCTRDLAARLTMNNVVDVLQLSRLCDAPDLCIKCMSLVSNEFKSVQNTEGWKFIQDHDSHLELEILQFLDEAESRQKRWSKNREAQSLFLQLSDAMACLEHVCTDGCTSVGPSDMAPNERREPCEKFSTCRALQLLIRHFATCKKRVNGRCCRCKQLLQLLRLHSSICDQTHLCRVPLCSSHALVVDLSPYCFSPSLLAQCKSAIQTENEIEEKRRWDVEATGEEGNTGQSHVVLVFALSEEGERRKQRCNGYLKGSITSSFITTSTSNST